MNNKILFIGLSSQSTGEISNLLGALSGCHGEEFQGELIVHENSALIAKKFPGTIMYHNFTVKDKFSQVLSYITEVTKAADVVVFIDINAVMLELNLKDKDVAMFYKCLQSLAGSKQVAVMDNFCSGVSDLDTYKKRKQAVEAKIHHITRNLPEKPLEMRYFTSILKARAFNQILHFPPEVTFLRPFPITYKQHGSEPNAVYFKSCLDPFAQGRGEGKKVLLTYSSVYAMNRLLNPEFFREMFLQVCKGLTQSMDIEEIIFLDPIGTDPGDSVGDVKISCSKRLDRDTFLKVMSEAYFTATFSFYSSLGATSIMNGIPFVSFSCSKASTEIPWMSRTLQPYEIAPFTSVGFWEDIAFYDSFNEGNMYADTIIKLDMADSQSYKDAAEQLVSRKAHDRIQDFLQTVHSMNVPTLTEVLQDVTRYRSKQAV
jgi:hypothetical protein